MKLAQFLKSKIVRAVCASLFIIAIVYLMIFVEPKDTQYADFEAACSSNGIKTASEIMPFASPKSQVCVVDLYYAGLAFEYQSQQDLIPNKVSQCERSAILRAGEIWTRAKNYYVSEGEPDGKWLGLIDCAGGKLSVFAQGSSGYAIGLQQYLHPNELSFVENMSTCVKSAAKFKIENEYSVGYQGNICIINFERQESPVKSVIRN